jgi:peroxiredoxin (alkyl hydroperoxide reductase subunit C)
LPDLPATFLNAKLKEIHMAVLVGKAAPDFTATAVYGNNEIKDLKLSDYKGKYVVLFFYPLDFTFVCPSELIAFDHRLAEFKKRNVEVIGVSIDSQFTHLAWKNTPVNNGGIGQVQYPLVADVKHAICQAYDVEFAAAGVAFRGSFLIDRSGNVRHQVVNDLPLGRNIDEMLRMIDALQFTEEHGEVCPAGWQKGKAGMGASPEGVAKYLAEHAKEL